MSMCARVCRGVHPPIPLKAMMHFPLFQISLLFSKNFQTVENFQNLTFSRKFLHFHPFFSHRPQISRKLLFPSAFKSFPTVLEKFTCFLHTFCVFRFPPYF